MFFSSLRIVSEAAPSSARFARSGFNWGGECVWVNGRPEAGLESGQPLTRAQGNLLGLARQWSFFGFFVFFEVSGRKNGSQGPCAQVWVVSKV